MTHASFYVSLYVKSAADNNTRMIPDAKMQFLDSGGNILANGISDEEYNFVHLIHPIHGDCHEIEKAAVFSKAARKS